MLIPDQHNLNSVSEEFLRVASEIEKIFSIKGFVIINADTGSGKIIIAQYLNQLFYPNKKLLTINLSTVEWNLLLAELFGFEKGIFTGAYRNKKSIFADNHVVLIDEFNRATNKMKVAIAELVETRRFRPIGSNKELECKAKLIIATNISLEKMLEEGNIDFDSYQRLSAYEFKLPSLNERDSREKEHLAKYFVKMFCDEYNLGHKELSKDTIDFIKKQKWPGNVRELKNIIDCCVILHTGNIIHLDEFKKRLKPVKNEEEIVFNCKYDELIKKYSKYWKNKYANKKMKVDEIVKEIDKSRKWVYKYILGE